MNQAVDILLSTYNSVKYLKEQIDSILQQTYTNWNLIIRDDGSVDSTIELIKSYKDSRIQLITDSLGNVGSLKSFSLLLEASKSNYIMFCDHDDIWLPEKIECFLIEIQNKEKQYPNLPILIHGNMILIDKYGRELNKTFWDYGKVNPKGDKLNFILIQNTVTGCSCIFNRALKELIYPVPEKIYMHDWWVGAVAATFGYIYRIEKPYTKYRLHGDNQVGVNKYSIKLIKNKIKDFSKSKEILKKSITQAEEILKIIYKNQEKINKINFELVYKYSIINRYNFFIKLFFIIKYNYFRYGLYRKIYQIFLLMFI